MGWRIQNHVRIANLRPSNWKSNLVGRYLTRARSLGLVTWEDMRSTELNSTGKWQTKQSRNCRRSPHHGMMTISSKRIGNVGRLVKSQLSHRPDMSVFGTHRWTGGVNKLARAVTKSTRACDKRLARLISHIHNKNDYRQSCHVGNTAQHCRLGLFQDSDFARDLEDSKNPHQGDSCAFFGSHTFVSTSLNCMKTAFSFTQFYRSWSCFFGCRFAHGWYSRPWSLGFGYWSITFFRGSTQHTEKPVTQCTIRKRSNAKIKKRSNREDIGWTTVDRVTCIHHTSDFKQFCHEGNTAQHSRLGLFQDSDFPVYLEDSKSTSESNSHVSLEVTRLFPEVGCVRNKHQFRTVLPNLRWCLLMQVYALTVSPLLISGIWSLRCYILLQ